MRKTYLGIWFFETSWFFFAFTIPFVFTMGIVFEATTLLTQIPSGSQVLAAELTEDINSIVSLFHLFIYVVVLFIPGCILLAIFFPQFAEYYATRGKLYSHIKTQSPELLLNEAHSFLKERPEKMSRVIDINEWIAAELSMGSRSEFYRYLNTKAPSLLDDQYPTKDRLIFTDYWLRITFTAYMLTYMLLMILVWSII